MQHWCMGKCDEQVLCTGPFISTSNRGMNHTDIVHILREFLCRWVKEKINHQEVSMKITPCAKCSERENAQRCISNSCLWRWSFKPRMERYYHVMDCLGNSGYLISFAPDTDENYQIKGFGHVWLLPLSIESCIFGTDIYGKFSTIE